MKTISHVAIAALLSVGCNVRLAGNEGEMVITGRVLATNGTPLDATLTAPNGSTTSDAGFYLLHLPGPNARVAIDVSATGFAPTALVLEQRPGVFHYHSDVVLQPPAHLNPGPDGGTFSVANLSVSFSGAVLSPGAHLELAAFTPELGPGAEETTEGDDERLQSLGLVYLRAIDPSGHETQLGGPVSISSADLPPLTGTSSQKTYTLNTDAVWQPGSSTDPSGTFVVTSPGFWQAARAVKVACVKGTVSAPDRSCAGERVTASASGLVSFDTVASNGAFCLEGPQGATAATLTLGGTVKPLTFPAKPGSCANSGDCMDLGVIFGTDADCAFGCAKGQTDDPLGCKDAGN